MIKVGLPYIVQTVYKSRVCVDLITDSKTDTLWFEVDREYEPYLCTERSDAYLVLLIYYAAKHGHDIFFEGKISEKLFYNIKYYLLDALCRKDSSFHPVQIYCKTTNEPLPCEQAVATGFSGGIDSLSTIHMHLLKDCPEHYKLTHITFFNSGSSSNADGTRALNSSGDDIYYGRTKNARDIANQVKIPLVLIDTNLNEYLKLNFLLTHTYRNCGTAMIMQKLFGVYYYSSAGFGCTRFDLHPMVGSSHYDDFTLHYLCNETIHFYSALTSYSRFQKTELIANDSLAQSSLNVCIRDIFNCGTCKKCIRTLLTLDILGKLDDFGSVFDIYKYRKMRKKVLAGLIVDKTDEFNDDLIIKYREVYRRFPFVSYLYTIPMYIVKYLWLPMKNILKRI